MCVYIYLVLYPPMSSNMASWEIPELNGVFFSARNIIELNRGFSGPCLP